jgi:SAM-dependent methyltransferase
VALILDKYAELDFIRDISPNDEMRMTTAENYFIFGLEALTYIKDAIRTARVGDPENILDVPSGHGRVLRMLKAAYPAARLTACDINRDAVDYCARVFGAEPLYSVEDPAEIELPGDFDLIWCGSLLTHVDVDKWHGFMSLFEEQLAPSGMLVFTTHGRGSAEEVRTRKRRFPIEDAERLIRDYDCDGFGFECYHDSAGYGISMSSPAWVCRQLESHSALRLLLYTEGGWHGRQDAVACLRAAP